MAESSQSFTDAWSEISIPFRADASLPAGGAQVALRFGFSPQTVDVANLQLLNHGHEVDPTTLPRTIRRYPGFEPDAAWRQAAADRIERLRRADLTVEVVDAAGRPVSEARVRVKLERHAFGLGACIRAGSILSDSPDDARYRETLVRHFDKAVFENDLEWEPWERGGKAAGGLLRQGLESPAPRPRLAGPLRTGVDDRRLAGGRRGGPRQNAALQGAAPGRRRARGPRHRRAA